VSDGREVRRASADGRFAVVRTTAAMADALAEVQAACFPTLVAAERMRAEHYRAHVARFPEGQLAVVELAAGRPVASSTDFRTRVDFAHYQHRYIDAVADNWLTGHDPNGDWLYDADIGVHPDYRGRGLSTLLYDAQLDLVRRLALAGQVGGGLPRGYHAHRDRLGIEAYVAAVVRGDIRDPTLSVQLRRGYHVWGLIPGYVDDPSCGGFGVFLVRRNPDRTV
jgi:GNAT superfamily N-acetyltransferase